MWTFQTPGSRRRFAGAFVLVAAAALSAAAIRWSTDPRRALLSAANELQFRRGDARLAEALDYKPRGAIRADGAALQTIRSVAGRLQHEWRTRGSLDAGRAAAPALLLAGDDVRALAVGSELLLRSTAANDLPGAIHASTDARLLVDFSAAALQRPDDPHNLLLAYEAADRAWRLTRAQSAAWNRAVAVERIGIASVTARVWSAVAANEPSADWAREAELRKRAAMLRAAAPPDTSLELFFYRQLFVDAANGAPPPLRAALATYLRGRDEFERNEYASAEADYAAAEAALAPYDAQLALIARDQRIRSACSQAKPGCLGAMRAFRAEVSGRYPWLAARAAHGEGQTLYRQGRAYEAAEPLQQALAEFNRLGDPTSAAFMHVLLANTYAAAGESQLALQHFLAGIASHTPALGDRRRRMLEDAIAFLLRHGYVATAELLLDDLAGTTATEVAKVMEAMLRGITTFRRGDREDAARHFARAHSLLGDVKDEASRADLQLRLAIAEAGSRAASEMPPISELDAAIAAHESNEFSVWLPQLLSERGAAHERTGDAVRAEADYRRAIAILESREPRIDETVLALGVAAPAESPFDRAIRLLLGQQRIAGALSIAQRSNALRISSLHARTAGVRDVFRDADADAGGDGVRELQSVLAADEIAIAQHLLRDELITWIVDRTSIRAMRRRVSMNDLLRGMERLRRDPAAIEPLSAALVRDWIAHVPRGATILIQPPPELGAVPFAVLTSLDREPLATRNAVTTAPSLRTFARAYRNDGARRGSSAALFAAAPLPGGNLPPLPQSVSEVAIASRSYADATIERHATRAQFLARSGSCAVVHFAGHVVVHAERPLFSALVFENGELLYAHELDGRSFAKARLVVLSGCDSGRTPRPTMSVANALLSQSVPSVVYTLWPVGDDVAEAFSIALHRAIAAGHTRADAVRVAQLALKQKWPNDVEAWAAFALAGAPGALEVETKGERLWTGIRSIR